MPIIPMSRITHSQSSNFITLRRRAFSLTELLVAIGILVLLVGLVTVAVSKAKRSASTARIKSDFQAIGMAIEAFKLDHGNYPGLIYVPNVPGTNKGDPSNDSYQYWRHNSLALCLIGPGQADSSGDPNAGKRPYASTDPQDVSTGQWYDGANGPGFRKEINGKIWPAYLEAEKFRVVKGMDRNGKPTAEILDAFGGPIQYYPRRGRTTAGFQPGQLVAPKGTSIPDPSPFNYHFDARDGVMDEKEVQLALGDSDTNGNTINNAIDGSEKLAFDGPYFLASLGEDSVPLDIANIDPGFQRKVFEARGRPVTANTNAAGNMMANDDIFSFDP